MSDLHARLDHIRIGRTPLVEIDGVYAKLECVNPCGSVKDRIAAYILTKARESGHLRPGQPIVEATSGNTGIALAYYGRLLGHPVTIVMPEHMTEERKALIRGFGADLVLCSKQGSFAEAAAIRDKIASESGAFSSDQFANPLNTESHRETTGPEIVDQVPAGLPRPIAFVAGVGTGGTLIGVGEALRSAWGEVAVIAVEPVEAAVMSGGPNNPHGIFGIGDGFVPEIAGDAKGGLHAMIDAVETVSTEEATDAARHLSETRSLCVGVSSGANYVVAKRLRARFMTVVTVFADGHHKYHSVGLSASADGGCPYQDLCAKGEIESALGQLP